MSWTTIIVSAVKGLGEFFLGWLRQSKLEADASKGQALEGAQKSSSEAEREEESLQDIADRPRVTGRKDLDDAIRSRNQGS